MEGGWVWRLPDAEGSTELPEGSEGSAQKNTAPFADAVLPSDDATTAEDEVAEV